MSRTYKDRNWKQRFNWLDTDEEYDKFRYETYRRYFNAETGAYETTDEVIVRYTLIKKPGVKPKVRRRVNNHYAWYMATPSWWTRLTMNRPQRRRGKLWERKVLFEDVEETDPPGVGRKPHNYFY